MMRYLACVLALVLVPAAVAATPTDNVLLSLERAGVVLDKTKSAEITTYFDDAFAQTDDAEAFEFATEMLVDLAELSLNAARPATRIRTQELHYQLLAKLAPGADNPALGAVLASDPMIHQIEPGIGMTERDIGWGMMLEAMHRNLPDDPRDMDIQTEEAEALIAYVHAKYESTGDVSRYFLAHLDAWAAGGITAWPELSVTEREWVVGVVTEPDIPPSDLLEKVLGTRSILYWTAGMDVGMTPEEVEAFPELFAYLAEGNLTAGMGDFVRRMEDMAAATASIIANHGVTMMMMDLTSDTVLGTDYLP